jgi:hypothetical protein
MNIFCPECKEALLLLVNGQEIKCLRTWKGEIHDKDCQHSPKINIATKKQVEEYKENVNPQTRENNLLSLLYRLNNPQVCTQTKIATPSQKPDFVHKVTTGKTTTRVFIPQQKIRSEGENKFSYDSAKYYYGIVWVEIEKKSFERSEILLKLHSFSEKEKGRLICGLLISRKGNLSILTDKLIKEPIEGQYSVAFFGKMELNKKNDHKFRNLRINDKHDITFEAINP